jgi:prophage regulatory protein
MTAGPHRPDRFVGLGEIALMLGVDARRASRTTYRASFPEPVARISLGRVWWRKDVEAWIREHRPT